MYLLSLCFFERHQKLWIFNLDIWKCEVTAWKVMPGSKCGQDSCKCIRQNQFNVCSISELARCHPRPTFGMKSSENNMFLRGAVCDKYTVARSVAFIPQSPFFPINLQLVQKNFPNKSGLLSSLTGKWPRTAFHYLSFPHISCFSFHRKWMFTRDCILWWVEHICQAVQCSAAN